MKPYEHTDEDGDRLEALGGERGYIQINSESTVMAPTGPELTEFLQAVADDTHVVIPVADLPEVEVERREVLDGDPVFRIGNLVAALGDREHAMRDIARRVAILHAMDQYEAEQGDKGEAKVEELAERLYRSTRPGHRRLPWGRLSERVRRDARDVAREAIAWAEEQQR